LGREVKRGQNADRQSAHFSYPGGRDGGRGLVIVRSDAMISTIKHWHRVMTETEKDSDLLVITFFFFGFIVGIFAGLTC
jgi:hypothetical protein